MTLVWILAFVVTGCSTVLTTWESHKFRKGPLLDWTEQERRALPSWLAKLPGCPSTLPDGAGNDPPKPFYHPGAAAQLRIPVEGEDYGQQCTYDEQGRFIEGHADGRLIDDTLAPGTSDRHTASPPGIRKNLEFLLDLNHFDQDVSWFAGARLLDRMDVGGPCTRAYLHVRPPPLGGEQPGSALASQLDAYEDDYRASVARCRAHSRSGVWRLRLVDLAITRTDSDEADAAWAFGVGTAFERDSDRWRGGIGYRIHIRDTPRSDVSLSAGLHLGTWVTVGARAHALVVGTDVGDTALAIGATVALRDAISFEIAWVAAGGPADAPGTMELSLTLTPWFKGF